MIFSKKITAARHLQWIISFLAITNIQVSSITALPADKQILSVSIPQSTTASQQENGGVAPEIYAQSLRNLITSQLKNQAQTISFHTVPAVTELLRKTTQAHHALAPDEQEWLAFFNDAFTTQCKKNDIPEEIQQAILTGVTRSARPTESNATGLSTPLPAIDQAIQAAIQSTIEYINRQGSWAVNRLVVRENIVGNVSVTGNVILGLEPTQNAHATTKLYVDTVAHGIQIKEACRALENTTDIALTGLPTIDGINLIADNRALLNHQTDAKQNGIWVVAAGAWSRPTDFATGSNAASAFTFIQEGITYADTGWICTNNTGHAVVDTDDLTFAQFSGPGAYTMANVGTGAGTAQVYKNQSGNNFNLRSLYSGTNIAVTNNGDQVNVATTTDINVPGNLTVNTDKFVVTGTTGVTTLKGDDAQLVMQDGAGTTMCTIDAATGNICSRGQIASRQATCTVSDRRIKTSINDLDPHQSLKTVNQLRPVSFYFTQEWLNKNKLPRKKQIGLIAQEVNELIPEAVSQTKFSTEEQLYTVSYEQIIPHLISCIQQLNAEIEQLREKLAKIEQH